VIKYQVGDFMRLRNVKNKEEIMNNSKYLVKNYYDYKGQWNKLFSNNNPIYIEIGMGKGKFIIDNAKMYPNINFIGIEKFDSVIAKSLLKVPEGLDNLYMIRADALDIDNIFDKEIDRIYLNFSDPWPKKRHNLRRLSSKVFLEKYDNIFRNNPIIHMRTDNRDLYTYSLVSFSEYGYTLKKISFDLHKDDMPSITTEYEDKFSLDNLPIYYVECEKSVQNSK
jgi:tRNA (guanine-N7-)-methyltransferase